MLARRAMSTRSFAPDPRSGIRRDLTYFSIIGCLLLLIIGILFFSDSASFPVRRTL